MKKPKEVKTAQNFVDDKRKELSSTVEKNREEYKNAMAVISESFKSMGVESISVGSKVVDLVEKNFSYGYSVKEEGEYANLLSSGGELFILHVSNLGSGYSDDELVDVTRQKLDDLLDVELIKSLAPTAKIYDNNVEKPWSEVMRLEPYQIFITDKSEFVRLWEELPKWVKLDWHDEITNKTKHKHRAKHVFNISIISLISPDLNWRIAKYKSISEKVKKAELMGSYNIEGQTQLKTVITSLLKIEGDSLFGDKISDVIVQLTPLLDKCMSGKIEYNKLLKEEEMARFHMNNGYSCDRLSYSDWTKELPTGIVMRKYLNEGVSESAVKKISV